MKKNFLEHFRYSIYHSNHHTAEMWDLEFGSNTTEKLQNSPKFFQIFQRVLKFFRGVIKPNSKSNLSAAWCLLLTPRHEPLQIWIICNFVRHNLSFPWNCSPKMWVGFQKFEWVFKFWVSFKSNTTIFPKNTDFQWNLAYILKLWSTNLGRE